MFTSFQLSITICWRMADVAHLPSKNWKTVFDLVEQTLVDRATSSSAQTDDAGLEARRAKVADDLKSAQALSLDPEMSDQAFWEATALKSFYAGTKSAAVDTFADAMMSYLRHWESLVGPDWEPSDKVGRGGAKFEAFLGDKNTFQNRPRLTKSVNAARALARLKANFPGSRFMEHIIRTSGDGQSIASQKKTYFNLRAHTNLTEVATFHLMMELGYPVLKPDRVVNRVAVRLGMMAWVDGKGRKLHPNATAKQTDNLGRDNSFAWGIQEAAQSLSALTAVSVRKIDLLLVKLGQDVNEASGDFRQTICSAEKPSCGLCHASPYCDYFNMTKRAT